MLKKYYKFALDKEALLASEQATYLLAHPDNFTMLSGIYEDTEGTPDTGATTVLMQDWTAIVKGYDGEDMEGNPVKQDLVGFLSEWLFSTPLKDQHYETFYKE